MLENKRENRKYKIGKEGGVKKEKIESIFMENYGDIILIIILFYISFFPFILC